MKATCHGVRLWWSKKRKKKKIPIDFNFSPHSFFSPLFFTFFLSVFSSFPTVFLPEFLFSQTPHPPSSPPHKKKRNERKTEAQGEGRNALTECMIDPFSVSLLELHVSAEFLQEKWNSACRRRSCRKTAVLHVFCFPHLNWKLTWSDLSSWMKLVTWSDLLKETS